MTNREFLFKGFKGCNDSNCIITGKAEGMHSNGGCKCLQELTRSQLMILQSRLSVIADNNLKLEN